MLRKGAIWAMAVCIGSIAAEGGAPQVAAAVAGTAEKAPAAVQKIIRKVEQMPNLPQPYDMKDWRATAQAYDRFVFDFSKQGEYLPVGWWDRTHYNLDGDTFGLMSYVGKFSQGTDGSQEAINLMAAVLSATLVGIDKSDQNGIDYVRMLQTFYNKDNGENVILNNPNTASGQSFWYELMPHLLHYALTYYYPGVDGMERIMRDTADRWAQAVQELGGKYGRADFNYTAFNFYKMEPSENGAWTEPDAAAGVAMLEYMAYAKFGDPKYLQAAKLSMDFLQRQNDNPLYEVLLYYAPYMAARMNAEQGTSYDIDKMVNWIFDGGSKARDGWGMIAEKWGDYDAYGLLGSLTDNGGYAFAMNTFAAFGALAPVVRYDPRFARDIGKWMLNAANQSRLFYADALPPDHQSGADWHGDAEHVIPYEGLRKQWKGQTPYAGGDPTVHAWGYTDFSLYSGSYAGFLGGLIEKTNVDGILKIDCLKTDYFHDRAYPTYLYYNPYPSERRVVVTGLGDRPVDLFDAATGSFVARNVTGEAEIRLAADQAAVLVFAPAGGRMAREAGQQRIDGVFVAPEPKPAVNLLSLQNRQTVSGEIALDVQAAVPAGERIRALTVTLDGETLYEGKRAPAGLALETTRFGNGFHRLRATLQSSGGGRDADEVELFVWNEGAESVISAGPEDMAKWKPIGAMPGKAVAGHGSATVTETFDGGNYGGIASPKFRLDLSRRSILVADVASVSRNWTVQLHVKGEPWGFYIKPDGPETGRIMLDVTGELRRLKPDLPYNGLQDVELWLIAAGEEGASASFRRLELFYQDDPPLREKDWSGRISAAAMTDWASVPSMEGRVAFDGRAAVVREDSLLNRGGVASPYLSVDLRRNPVLTVDVAGVTNQWSLMLYARGEQEGWVVQAPTAQTGKAAYDLRAIVARADPSLAAERAEADMQIWLLAEGDDNASVAVRSLRLAYASGADRGIGEYAAPAAALAIVLLAAYAAARRGKRAPR